MVQLAFRECVSYARPLTTGVKSALVDFVGQLATQEVWTRSTWCDGCDLRRVCKLNFNAMRMLFNVTSPTEIIVKDSFNKSCETIYHFEPRGEYNLYLNNCTITVTKDPQSAYFVYIIFAIYAFFLVAIDSLAHCFQSLRYDTLPVLIHSKPRILSIDAFRGLCIILMVFVNYGGTATPLFEHSPWDGVTFADLVFPWFLFNMGLSFGVSIKGAKFTKELAGRFGRRVVLLFFIGLFLVQKSSDWKTIRILGVLQRFALCQVLLLVLHFVTKYVSSDQSSSESVSPPSNAESEELTVMAPPPTCPTCVPDLRANFKQYLTVALVTVAWSLTTKLVPISGCPRGYLGPGGITHGGKYENCTGGLARWIDRTVMSSAHIYSNPTCQSIYECVPSFDPEGIWSTIPAFLNVFFGLQVASIITKYHSPRTQLFHLMLRGILLVGVSIPIHFFLFPYNKNLWSPSFALLTSGLAYVVFAVLFYLMDVNTYWEARIFRAAGQNAILCYVFSEIFEGRLPVWWPVEDSLLEQTLLHLWGVTTVLILAATLSYFYIQVSL